MARTLGGDSADGADGFLDVTMIPIEDESGTPSSFRGRILADRYKLTELLGSGSAGQVYRAEPLGDGPPVAVKVMRPHVAARPEYVKRFRREARAASLLDHPHVIRVLDLAEDPAHQTFFIVMELLEGKSLASFLRSLQVPPSLAEVEALSLPMLDALAAAHASGVVHRDLKPENVFLAKNGTGMTLKVLDFGLARVMSPSNDTTTLTAPNAVAGTPEYMSPEQCRSLHVGPSTDLYAFGCLLTELLQLEPPFQGASTMDIIAKQMFAPPPALNRPEGGEPVPPKLETLRLDLLAKEIEHRPRDIAEVRERLVDALSGSRTSPSMQAPDLGATAPLPKPKKPKTSLADMMKKVFGRSK